MDPLVPSLPARDSAERDRSDHISLLAGADVYFVEDDFEFVQVSLDSTIQELDKSYRQLAVSMHPNWPYLCIQIKMVALYRPKKLFSTFRLGMNA